MMKWLKNDDGGIMPLFAVLLTCIILFFCVIIDTGHLMYMRQKLNNSVSLSIRSMNRAINETLTEATGSVVVDFDQAKIYFQEDLDYMLEGVYIKTFDCEYRGNNAYIDTVVSYDVDLILMDLFGLNINQIGSSYTVRISE